MASMRRSHRNCKVCDHRGTAHYSGICLTCRKAEADKKTK